MLLISLSQPFTPDLQLFPLNSVDIVIGFPWALEISAGPSYYYVFPTSAYFDTAINRTLWNCHTDNGDQKKGKCCVCDGKLAVCGFLLPVSVRVWRDEGLLTHRFSPLCSKRKQLCNFWWRLSSSCIFPDNSDRLFNSTVKAWENWSHNIFFFCFWASITVIVAKSFCQWAQFYTLLWFRIHLRCCSTSPS